MSNENSETAVQPVAIPEVDLQISAKKTEAEVKKQQSKDRERERLAVKAEYARKAMLRQWAWPYTAICAESPVQVGCDVREHAKMLITMFPDGDLIWTGYLEDSGKPEHAARFQDKIGWLMAEKTDGLYICPSAFQAGSYSRSEANVQAKRFLVVGSTELTKDQTGAIFNWLTTQVGINLRAVVNTACKGLEGWFDYPTDEKVLEELEIVLPKLGCNPDLFRASQPVWLPGGGHMENPARLIYLGKEVCV